MKKKTKITNLPSPSVGGLSIYLTQIKATEPLAQLRAQRCTKARDQRLAVMTFYCSLVEFFNQDIKSQ